MSPRTILRLSGRRSATLVIGAGGNIEGFAGVGPTRDEDQSPGLAGEVRAIYLIAGAWGKGLGRQLMAAALRHLAAAGFETATLWVLDSNIRARGFCEAGGWSADGTIKHDDRNDIPAALKRQMYGRASLDLLRKRVIHHPT